MHQSSSTFGFTELFRIEICAICLIVISANRPLFAEPQSFIGLGALPTSTLPSVAIDVSADGSVVAGMSRKSSSPFTTWDAFQWTREGGLILLGELPGGQTSSRPYGISADGTTIVGEGNSEAGREPFRWSLSSGMVGLGGLPGQAVNGIARSTSANGDVVVGQTRIGVSGTMAFRWSSGTGMEALGDLPGGATFSAAFDCSADGTTIIGSSASVNGNEAFKWRADSGMVALGDLPGAYYLSTAYATTPNGDFVVGSSSSENGTSGNRLEAYLWSEQAGMIGLGDLPGGEFESSAYDVSADGSVVVGAGQTDSGYRAFIWKADTGLRNLKEVLSSDFGLELAEWELTRANAISDDGLTIVGEGINPDGLTEAWVAHIPEPSTSGLMVAGIIALFARKSRSRTPG